MRGTALFLFLLLQVAPTGGAEDEGNKKEDLTGDRNDNDEDNRLAANAKKGGSFFDEIFKPFLVKEIYRTPTDIIRSNGYPAEDHYVKTEDGYILHLHRIPYGRYRDKFNPKSPPVYLQHGVTSSSAHWMLNPHNNSMAFLLADYGYDVWLGNYRGNTYSRNHTFLNPDKKDFWDINIDHYIDYDVPNTIDYILNVRNVSKLHYIGYSMGSIGGMGLFSTKTAYNDKVISFHATGPAIFFKHMISPSRHTWFMLNNPMAKGYLQNAELMTARAISNHIVVGICQHMPAICQTFYFLNVGFDYEQFNVTRLPYIFAHMAAGVPGQVMLQLAKFFKQGKIQRFDYGMFENIRRYGTAKPPLYDLGKIKVPTYVYYAKNDWLVNMKDVEAFSKELGNLQGLYLIPWEKFNHIDYMFAMNAREQVYEKIISDMDVARGWKISDEFPNSYGNAEQKMDKVEEKLEQLGEKLAKNGSTKLGARLQNKELDISLDETGKNIVVKAKKVQKVVISKTAESGLPKDMAGLPQGGPPESKPKQQEEEGGIFGMIGSIFGKRQGASATLSPEEMEGVELGPPPSVQIPVSDFKNSLFSDEDMEIMQQSMKGPKSNDSTFDFDGKKVESIDLDKVDKSEKTAATLPPLENLMLTAGTIPDAPDYDQLESLVNDPSKTKPQEKGSTKN